MDIAHHLRTLLQGDVKRIAWRVDMPAQVLARQRLDKVAQHFPDFLCLLVQPWLAGGSASIKTVQTLQAVARIHLYARIVDDAIDEQEAVYRHHLLRVQALFWQSVATLASLYPDMMPHTTRLIEETIEAVYEDDARREPRLWGMKNHHLLLAPLLLSAHDECYQRCQQGLSNLMTLVQAGDEWRQGEFKDPSVYSAFIEHIPTLLDCDILHALKQGGWDKAIERMLWETQQLLGVLQTDDNAFSTTNLTTHVNAVSCLA